LVENLRWTLAAAPNEIPEGGLKNCHVNGRSVVLSLCGGRYGAIDSRCPHMGGPLGEGEILDGLLVCPWHGREYDPVSGECSLGEYAQSFPVELREDGVYVGLPDDASGRA
jgi:pyruvate oxidase